MTDTQYKVVDLSRVRTQAHNDIRVEDVCAPEELRVNPWIQALRYIDVASARGYRHVLSQHTGGAGEWMVLSSSPSLGVQTYPAPDVWRNIAVTKTTLAPGNALAIRVLAIRSGLMQRFEVIGGSSGWHSFGPYGRLRVIVDYLNEAAETAQQIITFPLPGSQEANGAELTTAGWSWSNQLHANLVLCHPETTGDAAQLAKWAENTEITVTIQHEGGCRVIHTSINERPYLHSVIHTEEDEVTVHGYSTSPNQLSAPELVRPQIEYLDGATYEEHRFGTARGFAAATKAGRELGPIIASWTCYGEDVAEVQDTDPDYFTASSSSWRGLSMGSSITSWSADHPGHDLPGHYARRAPECLSSRLDGAAAIPVRVRALVQWSTSGSAEGWIRFQSTERSWVDLPCPQADIGATWTWVEITGWLEASVAPDDTRPVLVDLWRRTSGSLRCRYWAVHYDGRDLSW